MDKLLLLRRAADLLSDDGENLEYDRAIGELVADLLGLEMDHVPVLIEILRSIRR